MFTSCQNAACSNELFSLTGSDYALDENVLTEQMWIFAAYFILRDHDTHIDFLPFLKSKALHFAAD